MKRTFLIAALLALQTLPLIAEQTATDTQPPGYKEIPYYLRKLEETTLEDERVRFAKFLHDAVVNANLADRRVVKEMEPFIERLQKAMDSGLDRVSITGQTNWLGSAVEYFEREKNKPVIEIPEEYWLVNSTVSTGVVLSTFPDKILVHKNAVSTEVVQHSNIHEAVLSPDARWIVYYRLIAPPEKKAELWLVNVANKRKKLIAVVNSCYTLLFSRDGGKIFFQSVPAKPKEESDVFVVSRGGGRPKLLTHATLLQSVVEKGPYRGNLILYRKTLHHLGVTNLECPFAYSEGGENRGRLVNATCH
jgi:hypothetical protein